MASTMAAAAGEEMEADAPDMAGMADLGRLDLSEESEDGGGAAPTALEEEEEDAVVGDAPALPAAAGDAVAAGRAP